MHSGDEYRKWTLECLQAAESMFEADRKITLLELAQRWRRLARQADEFVGDALLRDAGQSRRYH
jgi:hypothetical protein